MKKFLLFLTSVLFSFQFNSQILNQSAAWPNVTWTLSGTYDAGSLLADPTLSANFSYDDDNAGGGSTDILEASSPAIDLTAAYVGGETWINVSYDYDYNLGDVFILEWYDADALVWVAWDAIPDNSSAMSAWCAALTGAVTTSTTLDISAFTGTQLSGFQYRFNYDASSAWGWGFCMAAPTITSASPPSCMDPTALGATNITATSADLSWMAGGTETLWNIEYGPAGFTPGSGTTVSGVTNPHTLSGLTGATGYDYYVQADCGGSGTSAFAGPYGFVTPGTCGMYIVEIIDTYGDGWNGGMIDVYVNGVSFAAGYTLATGAGPDTLYVPVNIGDVVSVDYTAGSYATENEYYIYDQAGTQVAAEGAGGGTPGDVGDYTVFTGLEACPACADPTALGATNITTTSADLGWTVGGTETLWNIEYGPAGFTPGTGTMVSTGTNPYALTGLTSNTAYDFYVQADCGADSSAYVGPASFSTPCDAVTVFPFTESFEDTSATRDCWTNIQEDGAADWTYDTGSSGGAIATAYSGAKNARFVSQSGTNSPITKLVSPELDLTSLGTPRVVFYYGQEMWFTDQNYIRLLYRDSPGGMWTEIWSDSTNVAAWTEAMVTLPGATATYQVAFEGINNYGRANVVDEVRVEDTPACLAPTALGATNITATSADLSWMAGGTETLWNIEYGPAGFTPGSGTTVSGVTNPHTLSGLTGATGYDYYVQADCGGSGTSAFAGPYGFVTPGTCGMYIVEIIDTYGDGWNGGMIDVYVNGVSFAAGYTLATGAGPDTLYVPVNIGDVVSVDYTAGSYATENEYYIYDQAGTQVAAEGAGGGTPGDVGDYTVFTGLEACPACADPTALGATNITTTSADLGWTAGGTETLWNIEYGPAGFTPGTGTMVSTGTNPYALTGLTSNTAYDFYVQADCGADSSAYVGPASFSTPCDAVTVFPFTESFEDTSATRDCWTNIQEAGSADWTYDTGSSGGAILTAYSGAKNARFVSAGPSGGGTPATKLVSPELDLSSMSTPRVVFYYGQEEWAPDQNYIRLLYRDSPGGMWTEIWSDSTNVAAWTEAMVTLPGATATYQVAFEGINNYGRANVVDEVRVEDTPACLAPTALGATNITATSADLSWMAGGTETLWNIEYGPAGFTPGSGTTVSGVTNPHTLSGLTGATGYDYYVQADCGGSGTSAFAGPYGFVTPGTCGMYIVEIIDTYGDGWNGGMIDVYVNGVSFAAGYTLATGAGPDTLYVPVNIGDVVSVDYTAGSYATENEYYIYDQAGTQVAAEGAGGGTPGDVGDYTVFTGLEACPACADPTALGATNITTTSADLGWTAGGTETLWNIEYGPAGFTPGTGTMVSTGTNPYALTGLTSNTAYDFYVQADCGADSSAYVGPASFSTSCDAVTVFPFTESFEDTSATRDCWTNIQEAGSADWTYDTGSSGGAILTAYSGAKNARFVSAAPSGGGTPATKLVSPELDLSSMSTPRVVFYYGQEEWFSDQNFIRLLYRDNPAGVWTELWSDSTNVASWTEAMVTLPSPSATYQIAFEGINNYGRANVVDEVMVEETPACVAPTALASDSITTTSVQLSWTAGGTETVWNIQYGPAGFTPGTGTIISGVTSNPYLLTGLTAGTAYDFWVQADCGGDTSTYAGPSTFSTLAPPSCYYIINMEDSYGDGWNGANLQVDVAGIVATVELLAGSSGADTVYAYTGDLVTFTFASGTWDTEITYDIIDPLGAIVFTGSYTANTGNDGLAYTDSSSQSICAPPSCLPPGNLNAERSTSSSADLSWTEVGSATVWNIEYGPLGFVMGTGTTVLGVTSNPYTLTGLSIETAYDYYVQAVCSSSDSSSFAGPHTFQTLCGDTAAPYLNSFNDSVVDCWAQSGADNFDWTLNSGPTVSGTTGPTDDVTGGGNYFYIESSDPRVPGDSAILLTMGIDLSALTTPQLRFFSHMYGASTGTLKVDVTSDEGVTYTNVFSKSGDQGDQWNEETVNLSAFSGVVMFRITGVVGDDGTGIQYWSDIAIDDFEVREATGIYEQSSSNFSVYPNPSNGSFFVRNNGATNQYTIKVSDVNGKLIYTEAKTMNGYEVVNIDLEVETGVYLLSVSSKDSINTYRLILR